MSTHNAKMSRLGVIETQDIGDGLISSWHPLPLQVLALLQRQPVAAWVVGGAVRDHLIGRESRDVDFVVDGDARQVASSIAGYSPAGWQIHHDDRFLTVRIRDGTTTCDVATARRETYAHPGALPDITPGTLADDLQRRDFTVNSLAVPVTDLRAASAPAGSFEDVRSRTLRVFHPRSFQDDPTRILRLARYQAQLGFVPEPATRRWARNATPGLATLSPARLQHELSRILESPEAEAILSHLDELGALDPIATGPGAGLHKALADMRYNQATRQQRLTAGWLALLDAGLCPRIAPAAVQRLSARLATIGTCDAASLAPVPSSLLAEVADYHQDADCRSAARAAIARLTQYPPLDGNRVQTLTGLPPGPALGQAIIALRQRILTGELSSPETQENWLRNRIDFD